MHFVDKNMHFVETYLRSDENLNKKLKQISNFTMKTNQNQLTD